MYIYIYIYIYIYTGGSVLQPSQVGDGRVRVPLRVLRGALGAGAREAARAAVPRVRYVYRHVRVLVRVAQRGTMLLHTHTCTCTCTCTCIQYTILTTMLQYLGSKLKG